MSVSNLVTDNYTIRSLRWGMSDFVHEQREFRAGQRDFNPLRTMAAYLWGFACFAEGGRLNGSAMH